MEFHQKTQAMRRVINSLPLLGFSNCFKSIITPVQQEMTGIYLSVIISLVFDADL